MTVEPSDRSVRAATPRVFAALARRGADLDEAEDALQEALLEAAREWPASGTPADPTAWLVTAAGRRLVDQWRQSRSRVAREDSVARLATEAGTVPDTDDSVALLLLCCHPALPATAQVALTLRAVAGLSTAQIARAFLVPEATMAQRISRAKARLRDDGIRLGAVTAAELPARVDAALQVLYLVFTEGHTTTTGGGLLDVSLSDEAIRLVRELHMRLPAEPEVAGLLALLLLTDARRAARVAPDGSLVPLAEQDRSRWDRAMVDEGVRLVEGALPRGRVGSYQLQAAISAVHAEAPDAGATDWVQIEQLYRMLSAVAPGPVVTLNHAVAVAMADGPTAGLALLDTVGGDRRMTRHHRWHAVRAHLLERDGQLVAAAEAYATAAGLATSQPEQRYLLARAAELRPS